MEPTSKTTQPQAATEMKVMSVPQGAAQSSQQAHEHHQHGKASRIRGGGAGKDCFLGLVGCFLCFECCEVTIFLKLKFILSCNVADLMALGMLRLHRRHYLLPVRVVLLNHNIFVPKLYPSLRYKSSM